MVFRADRSVLEALPGNEGDLAGSQSPQDWQKVHRGALLPWWWLLWITSSALSYGIARNAFRAEEIGELITLNRICLVANVMEIPLALVTAALVNEIYKAQMLHVRSLGDDPSDALLY